MVTFSQPAGDMVDVLGWKDDEDHPTYPIGSKPKRLIWCPEDVGRDFLHPGRRYLFKEGTGPRALQVWSEIIAYRLGELVGASVPPAFVAIDSATGRQGALIEYFIDDPDQPQGVRLVHGADLMQGLLDKKRGRPHGLIENILLCRAMKARSARGTADWWAGTLAFDAMIGNRDRHPENWGFLVHNDAEIGDVLRMAPLYDNGVSLGYETLDGRFDPAWSEDRARAYVAKGVHHCGWSHEDDKSAQHALLCGRLADRYPSVRPTMQAMTAMADADVSQILEWATAFDGPLPFNVGRAAFVATLTKVRRDALLAAV